MMSNSKAADDVPGIFKKPQPISFDELWEQIGNQGDWQEWFAESLGTGIEQAASSTDPAISRDAERAEHLHSWLVEKLGTDPDAMKIIHNAYELGRLVVTMQVRPYDDYAKTGRRMIRVADEARERKKIADIDRREEKHDRAIEAMKYAAHMNPTLAADYEKNLSKLKAYACQEEGISRDTLDRWLKPLEK